MIPGLENAEFIKYGVMHRNTYINSTELLDETYNLKSNPNIYFAGQITGVEGYVESISSGMVASLNAILQFESMQNGNINLEKESHACQKEEGCNTNDLSDSLNAKARMKSKMTFSEYTIIGALAKYISTPNTKFQPMNANFGILPELEGKKIKDKKERYMKLAKRSLENIEKFL